MAEEVTDAGTAVASPETSRPPAEGANGAVAAPSLDLLDWHNKIPEDIRDEPVFKQYRSEEALYKAHNQLSKLLGRNVQIPVKPLEEAPEEWGKVYDKLGRPKDHQSYELTFGELPEGPVGWSEARQREYEKEAWEAGLNPAQAQRFANLQHRWLTEDANRLAAQVEDMKREKQQELRTRHGANTNAILAKARHLFAELGKGAFGTGEEGLRAWEKIVDTGFGNDVDLITSFANMCSRLGEADLPEDMVMVGNSETSLQALERRGKEITALEFKNGGLTKEERAEKDRVYTRIVELRRQHGQTSLTGAPML